MGKSAAQQRKAGEKASKKASKQTVEELRAATTHPCTKLHLYQVGEYQLQDAQLLEPFEVTSRKWNQKIGGECRGTALPLTAADCRWLPLAAAGPGHPASGIRGLRGGGGRGGRRHTRCSPPPPRRGEAQRWRAERIGALCHSVAGRAAATESGAEEDEAGAAFTWKWNIDGGELFEECLRRAKWEGHLPDLMRGCPFSGQTALTRRGPCCAR